MTVEEVRLHISYSGWASRKLLGAGLALSEEEQHRDFGVSYATLHRGQAMSLLRQLGVAPPPTDLI
jgi:uncharacterized damage-inducible protein DinB